VGPVAVRDAPEAANRREVHLRLVEGMGDRLRHRHPVEAARAYRCLVVRGDCRAVGRRAGCSRFPAEFRRPVYFPAACHQGGCYLGAVHLDGCLAAFPRDDRCLEVGRLDGYCSVGDCYPGVVHRGDCRECRAECLDAFRPAADTLASCLEEHGRGG